MTIQFKAPELAELRPRIAVIGVGGAGGNALNNMIAAKLDGVRFIAANTDAQALIHSRAETRLQLGAAMTEGLGAGAKPEIGAAAAEQSIEEIRSHLRGLHMAFITAGMGGGTGTGAAPVIASVAREEGVLTVGVVTKPFHFEGQRRMRAAEIGIQLLAEQVDTLIVIPNQNLFRVAVVNTTFSEAFNMADRVLHDGIACITDVMVKDGIINLDFADVNLIMRGMGQAMMGTGEARGENRGRTAAEAAISNPLLDDVSLKGARGLLVSIVGGKNDLTLYEVDEAANRVREEVDPDANIIVGTAFDETLNGVVRVSVVATGLELHRELKPEPARNERGASGARAADRNLAQPRQRAERPQPAASASRGPAPEAGGEVRQTAQPPRTTPAPRRDPLAATQAEAERRASLDSGLKADPAVRMPQIEDFPPQGQALLRQQAGESPNHHGRSGLLGKIASVTNAFKTSLDGQQTVAHGSLFGSQNAAPDLRVDPVMIDPHAKGGALSRGGEALGVKPAASDEDADFPAFLRK